MSPPQTATGAPAAIPVPRLFRDPEAARGDGRTPQGSLLVMAPVSAERLQELERTLAAVQDPSNYSSLSRVHFLRILIHHPSPSKQAPIPVWNGVAQVSGPPIPPKLLFSTDYDGPLDEHLDELLSALGPLLDRVLGFCDAWPGYADREAAHGFFHRFRVPSNTFYTGTMGRSVDQIHREAALREKVEAFLDESAATPGFPTDPAKVRDRVREWVFAQPELAWAREKPGPFPSPALPSWASANLPLVGGAALVGLVLALAALLTLWFPVGSAVVLAILPFAALAVLAGAAYAYLSYLAARDPVIIRDDVHDHTADLVQTEDRIVQNEMSSVIYIKRPLWFRRLVLKAVLGFIDLAAKYLNNQGSLAGIPSIHFARWVVVDEGRRLVFFSNFDGSWENYLGDFIDRAHSGLTAVWSNCVGFPRTVGLTGRGATDEQRFKAYSRQSQIRTQVWYSAYRWLSVSNINDNTRLRLGLYGEMDPEQAAAWLRGTVAVKAKVQKPAALPRPRVDLDDVQGLVARSFAPLRQAVYVPVTLDPANRAGVRTWIDSLAGEVTTARTRTGEVAKLGRAVNVAFTRTGIAALGVEEGLSGFSREFDEGMISPHRQRVLGDTGPAKPEEWEWGGPGHEVHAMLLLYADTPERLDALRAAEAARALGKGVTLGEPLGTVMLDDDREHFGFHDGIAQPRVAGLGGEEGAPSHLPEIPAGEVLLGYPNAYGVIPMSPTVPDSDAARECLEPAPEDETQPGARRDLGRNGSYLVFRTLEQDVRRFWEFMDERAGSDAERRRWLAAKMVGRWPNGAPLVKHPDREPESFDRKTANDFWYRDDLAGERCPLGSHIRRSNPRDGMEPNTADSLLVADRHRLLRRGRAYGAPLAPSFDPADVLAAPPSAEKRGLHFICFSTDIARQFEFVQNTWNNSMKFDGLYQDPDPVIGPHVDPADPPHPEEVTSFTVQRCPVRHRELGVPRFVTMRGGAYFFLPGIRALRYLARA